MKTNKIQLEQLRVSSFVTNMNQGDTRTAKGGSISSATINPPWLTLAGVTQSCCGAETAECNSGY